MAGAGAKLKGTDESSRKRSVEATLREAEERAGARSTKPSLSARLRQAELTWTRGTYYLICTLTGVAIFLLTVSVTDLGKVAALGFGICGSVLVPHWYVNARRRRRFKRFAVEFPNAIDVVVRGVKVGLPLSECFNIVAAEAQKLVADEFKLIVEDQSLGMPLAEAVERLPHRVPIPEASFFAIAVGIQTRTGGNLSEALANLSRVLRDRQKVYGKIKAMSAESKASAFIVGSIPIFVVGAVYLISPKYMQLLFTTQTGKLVLFGCAVWMFIGILTMRKMINFDV